MSPAALGGYPHTRASSINSGGPVGTASDVHLDRMAGINGGNRVFPHLDDLVAVKPDVDINSPIRKILQDAELLAKQADTHLDFQRPDIALQEYIKAYIVAIDIIPHHKDYVMLQTSKGELSRIYAGLNKRINAQHARFAEVKLLIKENNAKSGVKPVGSSGAPKLNGVNGHARSQSAQGTPLNPLTNGARKKPPVQPKPNALHGNAISPPAQTDLAARFASLRSGGSNEVVQDPRIRTQSISIPGESVSTSKPLGSYTNINRPTGPREMPSVPTNVPGASRTPLDVQIPAFPRAPDAIYSPSQNADTPAAANLLSSIPRSGSYVGTSRAAPPISTHIPTPKIQENKYDYFTPAHTRQNSGMPEKKSPPAIPDSVTVTAEDLMTYLSYGSHVLKVLLVDVRSREDFDMGHILTPSIICVEPITIRAGISAEQLGDTMIINPDTEQALYEHRDEFDLIVFYDQSSESLKSAGTGSDATLLHFSKAVYEYDYEKRLKRRPMLLVGGLEAWKDLLGPNSLKASISRTSSPAPDSITDKRATRPLGRLPPARRPPAVPLRRKKTHSSRPFTKEEEDAWDETLRADSAKWKTAEAERAASAELVYAKTTEDFFRRYPELPAIQESMTSPVPAESQSLDFAKSMAPPPPPARPAPALPRQRSSGLFERGPVMAAAHSTGITEPVVAHGLTGLTNEHHVTCYMNAAVQAISATPFLRELLLHFNKSNYPVPRKSGESTNPPQLMVRSFNILMNHLWSGAYNYLTPQSFGKYVNSVHAGALTDERVRDRAYAGRVRQHDSAEFFNFLIEIIDDELNPRRNSPPVNIDDPEYELAMKQQRLEDAANYAWRAQCSREDSPITRKMKGIVGRTTQCKGCKGYSRTFELFTYLTVNLPNDGQTYPIKNLCEREWGTSETIDEYSCPHCKSSKQTAIRTTYLCYVPDYLVIQLNRYNNELRKLTNKVKFPEGGLDLSAACIPANQVSDGADPRMKGPFFYDTYAVTMHQGPGIQQGHYYILAKSPDKKVTGNTDSAGRWHMFNDKSVTQADFSNTQGEFATILYLKRRGRPDI